MEVLNLILSYHLIYFYLCSSMIWWCRTTALLLCIPPFIPSGRQTALGDTSCWFTSGSKRRAAAAAGASGHLAPLSSKHVNHNRKCQCHHSWAYSLLPLQPEHMQNQIRWVKMYKIKINESNQSWTVCSCIALAVWQPWKCETITFNFKKWLQTFISGRSYQLKFDFLFSLINSQ